MAKIKMKDLRELVNTLEGILGTTLWISEIKDGSIVFTFHTLHEFDMLFPLDSKQEERLRQLGVTRIYSTEQGYYEHFLTEQLLPSDEPSKYTHQLT